MFLSQRKMKWVRTRLEGKGNREGGEGQDMDEGKGIGVITKGKGKGKEPGYGKGEGREAGAFKPRKWKRRKGNGGRMSGGRERAGLKDS